MARLLYGADIAEKNFKDSVELLVEESGRFYGSGVGCVLSILQVGSNPASNTYVRKKLEAVQKLNSLLNETEEFKDRAMFITQLYQLSNCTPYSNVVKSIMEAENPVIPQFPMYGRGIDKEIAFALKPEIDIDGLSEGNQIALYNGEPKIIPCTAKAVMDIFEYECYNLEGKVVMIAGKSDLVGKPLIHLLLACGATVISINSKTPRDRIKPILSQADVLITAIGVPKYFNAEIVPDCLDYIIDVGITKVDGKLVGDVDPELYTTFRDGCTITPVPNGIGAITVSNVIYNLVTLYAKTKNHKEALAWR